MGYIIFDFDLQNIEFQFILEYMSWLVLQCFIQSSKVSVLLVALWQNFLHMYGLIQKQLSNFGRMSISSSQDEYDIVLYGSFIFFIKYMYQCEITYLGYKDHPKF